MPAVCTEHLPKQARIIPTSFPALPPSLLAPSLLCSTSVIFPNSITNLLSTLVISNNSLIVSVTSLVLKTRAPCLQTALLVVRQNLGSRCCLPTRASINIRGPPPTHTLTPSPPKKHHSHTSYSRSVADWPPHHSKNSYCYYYNPEHTVDTACLVCALGCPQYDSARKSLDRCSDRRRRLRPRADSCCKGQRLQVATNSTGLGLALDRSIVDLLPVRYEVPRSPSGQANTLFGTLARSTNAHPVTTPQALLAAPSPVSGWTLEALCCAALRCPAFSSPSNPDSSLRLRLTTTRPQSFCASHVLRRRIPSSPLLSPSS